MGEKEKLTNYIIFATRYIMNTGGLAGIEEAVRNDNLLKEIPGLNKPLSGYNSNTEKKEEPNQENKIYEHLKNTGIYDQKDLPQVAEDFGNNISNNEMVEEKISTPDTVNTEVQGPEYNEKTQEKVLVKKPNNNPWADAVTVSPGQMKL